jgi:hypothetical protein
MTSPTRLQRATTWMAIVGYALVASGLPLPVGLLAPGGDVVADTRLAAKDRSRPFPCMDKPCGCATAEQCFANCCCHTPAERLAWAKAHRVEPAVLTALERRIAADAAPAGPAGGCCAAKAKQKPACCSADVCDESETAARVSGDSDVCTEFQSLASEPHAATESAAVTAPDQPDADHSRSTPRVGTVTLKAMLACGGILTQWLAVGGSLPPPRIDLVLDAPFGDRCPLGDSHAEVLASPPDAPPPRAA